MNVFPPSAGRCALSVLAVSVLATASGLAAPAWWTNRQVVVVGATANDYAAANLGQLKWFATNACKELDQYLPNGAGATAWTLVRAFSRTNSYVAVNQGQLKAVVKPFYDRLMAEGYTNAYPWTTTTADDANYALVNLGQVKRVFAFDWLTDHDGDGLGDRWELAGFGTLAYGAAADPDGDGRNNLLEYQQSTHPNNPDTQRPTVTIVYPTNLSQRIWIP